MGTLHKENRMTDYIRFSGGAADIGIRVFRAEEGGRKIAYSPSLNIVGYGDTVEEADSDFDFCLKEFISRAVQEGYLDKEMKKLGWEEESLEMSPSGPLSKDNICN